MKRIKLKRIEDCKVVLTTSDLKWRGKKDGLPVNIIYKLTYEQAQKAFATKKDPDLGLMKMPDVRAWLVDRIKADYGKRPSNKFWFYLSFE